MLENIVLSLSLSLSLQIFFLSLPVLCVLRTWFHFECQVRLLRHHEGTVCRSVSTLATPKKSQLWRGASRAKKPSNKAHERQKGRPAKSPRNRRYTEYSNCTNFTAVSTFSLEYKGARNGAHANQPSQSLQYQYLCRWRIAQHTK